TGVYATTDGSGAIGVNIGGGGGLIAITDAFGGAASYGIFTQSVTGNITVNYAGDIDPPDFAGWHETAGTINVTYSGNETGSTGIHALNTGSNASVTVNSNGGNITGTGFSQNIGLYTNTTPGGDSAPWITSGNATGNTGDGI